MPFSVKQREYLDNADKRWNFKLGAVRSGKTYVDYYVIPKRIRERVGKPGLAVILGVTKSTVERNLLEPMRQMWGEDLVGSINSQNVAYLFGEKVYCLGAEKVSQVSKIRGSSIKYCYGDEVADWNEDVFEILKSRLDKPYSVFDGSLNPQSPNHWLKRFIENPDYDIYAQHYTIFDNPFLPKSFVDNLCAEYKGSVYYKRYILGEWALAEGLVYPMFSDKNIIHGAVAYNPKHPYYVAIDYGTVNPFAAGLFEFDGRGCTMVKELHYSGREQTRMDNEGYYELVSEMVGDIPIEGVVVDPSAAGFIETVKKHNKWVVRGADNDVINGIQEVTKYINYGLLKVHEDCTETLKEFQEYAWDENSEKDEVIKENDHHMDLIRYFIYTICRKLNRWVV